MNGKHHVEVQNRDVVYKFDLNRKITVVRGDSGTGKTTLYEMIVRHARKIGAVTISCDKQCDYLESRYWDAQLKGMHDCIIFTDEKQRFVLTKEFAEAIKDTDNYYVLFTRENFRVFPEDDVEVCEMKTNGREHWLVPVSMEYSGSSEKA